MYCLGYVWFVLCNVKILSGLYSVMLRLCLVYNMYCLGYVWFVLCNVYIMSGV